MRTLMLAGSRFAAQGRTDRPRFSSAHSNRNGPIGGGAKRIRERNVSARVLPQYQETDNESRNAASARIVLLGAGESIPSSLEARYGMRMLIESNATYLCDCTAAPARLRVALPGDVTVTSGSETMHPASAPRTILNVSLSEDVMATQAAALGIDRSSVRIEPAKHARDPELQRIGWAFRDALARDGAFETWRLSDLSAALARRLLRRYANVRTPGSRQFSKEQMLALRLFIDEHIDRRISIARLARFVKTSPTNFKILFNGTAGVSAHRYVVERRVSYAMSLIRSSTAPLSEIALQAGFFDQSHMTRCMRRVLGITPTAVRAAL